MRTIRALCVAAALLVCPPLPAPQAPAAITLDALEFMQGKWVGEGTSEMGQGSRYFTFEADLGAKCGFAVIMRNTPSRTASRLLCMRT